MKSIAISKPYVSLSQSSNMSAPILNLSVRLLIWSRVYSIVSTVWMPPWAMIGPHVNFVSSREWTIIRPPRSRSPSITASFFNGHTYDSAEEGSPLECRMWRTRTSGNGFDCDTDTRRDVHPVTLWLEHATNENINVMTVIITTNVNRNVAKTMVWFSWPSFDFIVLY